MKHLHLSAFLFGDELYVVYHQYVRTAVFVAEIESVAAL